jgi:hypothetical protein
LSFRNGSSYDRYWEGRKDFQSLTSHVRTTVTIPEREFSDDLRSIRYGISPASSGYMYRFRHPMHPCHRAVQRPQMKTLLPSLCAVARSMSSNFAYPLSTLPSTISAGRTGWTTQITSVFSQSRLRDVAALTCSPSRLHDETRLRSTTNLSRPAPALHGPAAQTSASQKALMPRSVFV